MQLTFKQKMSFILDNFDVYDENENIYFSIKGKFTWLIRQFNILDKNNNLIGELKEDISFLLPRFTMIENGVLVGKIKKEMTFLKPKFTLTCSSWNVDGDWREKNYTITDNGKIIATIDRKYFSLFDTYYLNITNEKDALKVLMIVLAIEIIRLNVNNQNTMQN